MKLIKTIVAVVVIALALAAGTAGVGNGEANKADIIHPDIHSKVGRVNGTANANPNGANANGGQIHGIANAQGGNGGVANLGNVHGGIGTVNKNAG